jgi:cell wall-associated NlpC family hydrolase
VRQYIGIPYKHLGRSKDALDCYGLVVTIYRDKLGIELPDVCQYKYGEQACEYMEAFYTEDKYEHVADFHKLWEPVEISKLQKYDVILFNAYKGVEAPTHSGVYLGSNKFIHVMYNLPVTISRFEKLIGVSVHSAYRYKERSDINDNC